MKKFIIIFLTLLLFLSLSATAFADSKTDLDDVEITLKKVYKLVGEGSSPAETFTLQQIGDGRVISGEADHAPALGTITGAQFAVGAATTAGVEENITIVIPRFGEVEGWPLGIYEYTLQEVDGKNAGVSYNSEPLTLRVIAYYDENVYTNIAISAVFYKGEGEKKEKIDTIENEYDPGKLIIEKEVTGNLGDRNKYFKFTATLTGEEGKTYYPASFTVSGGSYESNPKTGELKMGENIFYLKHGETVTIANLPAGTKYTVTEDVYSDYTTTCTDNVEGTITKDGATVKFTNDKGIIDTGISLDSIPYVVLFIIAALGMVFILGKRRFN